MVYGGSASRASGSVATHFEAFQAFDTHTAHPRLELENMKFGSLDAEHQQIKGTCIFDVVGHFSSGRSTDWCSKT